MSSLFVEDYSFYGHGDGSLLVPEHLLDAIVVAFVLAVAGAATLKIVTRILDHTQLGGGTTVLIHQLFFLSSNKKQEEETSSSDCSSPSYKRRYSLFGKNGPPCVPYEIPFYGSEWEFRQNPMKFITKWRNVFKSDGCFAFRLGFSRVVMVTDPDAADYIVSGRVPQLTFQHTKNMMMKNSMRMSKEGARFASQHTKSHAIIHRHLMQHGHLSDIILDWQRHLNDVCIPEALSREGSRCSIYHLFGEALYCATARMFFGGNSSIATKEQFDNALLIDNAFAPLQRIDNGWIQRFMYPNETKAREEFVNSLREMYYQKNDPRIGQMFRDLEHSLPNMSEDDRIRYFALLLFASILNSVPTAFWVVYYLLAGKGALEAVQNEIDTILKKRDGHDKSDPARTNNDSSSSASAPIFTLEELDEMKNLDSIISETLRLKSTAVVFRFRRAKKEFDIDLKIQGKSNKFHVKQNDLFLTSPTLVHQDPHIYDNPMDFQWDRFLNNPEGRPVYRKDDPTVEVKTPLNAFGGGPSICPGRKFARCEIKAVVAAMVSQYDMTFAPDETTGEYVVPPPPEMTYQGSLRLNGTPASHVFIDVQPKKTRRT